MVPGLPEGADAGPESPARTAVVWFVEVSTQHDARVVQGNTHHVGFGGKGPGLGPCAGSGNGNGLWLGLGHGSGLGYHVPMLKQDYINRLIEQMAQVFARLVGRARTDQPCEVRKDLDETLMELTGLDFQVLEALPLASVLGVFGAHSEPDPARTLAVAECSFIRAELADREGRSDQAERARVLAATLYLETFLYLRSEHTSAAQERMDKVLNVLGNRELPFETELRLFRFRAREGRMAEAEDSLFAMLEARRDDRGLVEEGRAFYHRLLELSDDELERGNLPRDEVIEGLAELDVMQ